MISQIDLHILFNNLLAKNVGAQDFKSTNVKLTTNNYSLTTIANRRWSNMFSLSPRHHGRANSDFVSNINTSSTENSNNNLSASSASSQETAITIHKAALSSHDDATVTEIGAISAALPTMLCGLTYDNFKPKAHASDQKNSVDDNAEQRIAIFGINKTANYRRTLRSRQSF